MTNRPLDQEAIQQDFLAHLEARLGLDDEAAAVSTLGDWLSSYQPGPAALARAMSCPWRQRTAA